MSDFHDYRYYYYYCLFSLTPPLCSDIVVKDLHASWRDGLAFCALIATNKPGALDLNKARSLAKAEQRLAMAFEALAGLGVPSLLDPADFPEEESKIVTYLSLIQKAFGVRAYFGIFQSSCYCCISKV